MSEASRRPKVVLSLAAQLDIREALVWSEQKFGNLASRRYRALLKQALRDIAADPELPGSRYTPRLSRGVRTYHLFFSRDHVRGGAGIVRSPRHFLIYRKRGSAEIEIIRLLHDARDMERHVPSE